MNKVVLKFGDKEFTAKLGIGFIECAVMAEGITDGNIDKVPSIRKMYYAIKYGREVENKDFMPIPEFYDLLDSLEAVELESVLAAFNVAFLRSFEKKFNFNTAAKKEYDKAMSEMEKKILPPKKQVAKS